jgi:rod shape-determining protein MreD
MSILGLALALALALATQSALSLLLPGHAQALDLLLVVTVWAALVRGETPGMLVGMAAGWIEDVHFGGRTLGMSALAGLSVGYGVGVLGARFLFTSPSRRALVVSLACLSESALQRALIFLFSAEAFAVAPRSLVERALVTGAVSWLLFGIGERVERRGAA